MPCKFLSFCSSCCLPFLGASLTAGPVWPPAPAPARIAYVQSLHGPADVGQKPSVLSRVSGWLSGRSANLPNLVKPFGLGLDELDNLSVTDTGNATVSAVDFTHKTWRTWAAAGKQRFASPVAVVCRNKVWYVADSGLGKVVGFRDNGDVALELAAPLKRPVALALVQGKLYVADAELQGIYAFGLDGKFQFKFGQRGVGAGEFNFPTHLGCDGQGQLFVTDSLNARVEMFSPEGRFVKTLGSAGDSSGHFGRPKGLALDSAGHVYVVDAAYDNFQIFDEQGRFLLDVGGSGSGPGEFWIPNGIAIDSKNRIYLADTFNRRIQVFDYVGKD